MSMTSFEIARTVQEYAKEHGLVLKHDKRYDAVITGLVKKEMHCPCRVVPTPCPCPDCLAEVAENGCCYCGLFWRDRE